ncbi:G1/S-specific cyclin Cln3p [Diutina catenulata]
MASPLPFHQVRQLRASLRANLPQLRQAEHQAHAMAAVSEYRLEMLHHLLRQEQKSTPSLVLIEQQPEIKLGMRPLLLDFLMEVICILNLSPSTFPLTVNLIDRYCSTRIVKKQHYQLLGLTCLWVACKNLDSKYKIPTLHDLRKICVDYYYKELFIEMEKHVLKSLEWRVSSPTFDGYVDLLLELVCASSHPSAGPISAHRGVISQVAIYIGELFQFYPNIYFDYSTSQIALIALLVAVLSLKIGVNVASTLAFINGVVRTPQYRSLLDAGEHSEDLLTSQQFQRLFTKSFFRNVVKMIENPPKSLTIKYFGDNTKYPHMRRHVDAMSRVLATLCDPPVTPRVSVSTSPNLPLTPVSNSTSPKMDAQFAVKMSPSYVPYSPASTVSPRKRSYDDFGDLVPELKKSKSHQSFKPMFYLP